MTDYLKIAESVVGGTAVGTGGLGSAVPPASPSIISDSRTDELVMGEALALLNRVGVRLIERGDRYTLAIWPELDSAELRHAISLIYGDAVPVVSLYDASISPRYRQFKPTAWNRAQEKLAAEGTPFELWKNEVDSRLWAEFGVPRGGSR